MLLRTYLSSKHHNEAWMKGGYLLLDASPIPFEPLERVMEYVTVNGFLVHVARVIRSSAYVKSGRGSNAPASTFSVITCRTSALAVRHRNSPRRRRAPSRGRCPDPGSNRDPRAHTHSDPGSDARVRGGGAGGGACTGGC